MRGNLNKSYEMFGDVIVENQCVQDCSEYLYDSDVSSVIIDFDLDCGPKNYLKQFVHSPYWLGYLASNIFVGYLGWGQQTINSRFVIRTPVRVFNAISLNN